MRYPHTYVRRYDTHQFVSALSAKAALMSKSNTHCTTSTACKSHLTKKHQMYTWGCQASTCDSFRMCNTEYSGILVKLPEPLRATAQAVKSPFFGVADFSFATARA